MTNRRAIMLRALISTAKQYIDPEDDYPPITELLFTPDLDYAFTWAEVESEFEDILNESN